MAVNLVDRVKLDAALTATAGAIRAKTGSAAVIPFDMGADCTGFKSAIDGIPIGGLSTPDCGVVFIDFDGSVVDAWGSADALLKTALPQNPAHDGLIAQGWNWTLADVQAYILSYPDALVVVGQLYETVSGLTEIDIEITAVTGLTIPCNVQATKDWGDGTSDNLTTHTYQQYGSYTIKFDNFELPGGTSSSGGLFSTSSSNSNQAICKAIRCGKNRLVLQSYTLCYCTDLATITTSSATEISKQAFYNCYSLKSITFGQTLVQDSALYGCTNLLYAATRNGAASFGASVFRGCTSLLAVTVPNSVSTVGSNCFYECYSIKRIVLPASVSSIPGSMVYNCYRMGYFSAYGQIASIGATCFYNTKSLRDMRFFASDPPTLGNNALYALGKWCRICVPESKVDTWKSNWASYANQIYAIS